MKVVVRSVTDAPAAFLAFGGEAPTVSRTGYITAFARSLSRRSDPPEMANDDHLAEVFLLPLYRLLLRSPRLTRRIFDAATPGAVAYFNARTRHIDAIVREQIAAGIDQVVVLGAGFDSRSMRFGEQLGQVRVFE
ncbi:MAG: class I SAM-dependent methyltransferase, partial [Polyangiaceae bacterium]